MSNKFAPKLAGDSRGSLFFVVSEGQSAPLAFTGLVARDGVAREVVRLAGGCKGLNLDADAMHRYFLAAFRTVDADGATVTEFHGTAFSGGTANADSDGSLKTDMITNVPGVLAAAYPCIAMSTTPRTGDMALDYQHGGVVVDLYGGRLDYRQHANLVFQKDPGNVLDWDGDLELYLTLMEGWKSAGFATAIIAMNGGDVTRDEIYKALARGIPVIAVEGSLRETDAFIKAFRDGDFSATAAEMRAKLESKSKSTEPADKVVEACEEAMGKIDRSLVSIVKLNEAAELRAALVARGFLAK